MITQQQLDGFVGESIGEICANGYANPHENHSAHFVSHVLGYNFGVTCQSMGIAKAPGATLRVQELFPKCPTVGLWSLRPASLKTCLVFLTKSTNVTLSSRVMANVGRKHVGIYLNGMIWHYSNARHQVVRQMPAQFAQYYPAPDKAMFFGLLP
jgi:hypothetical protein